MKKILIVVLLIVVSILSSGCEPLLRLFGVQEETVLPPPVKPGEGVAIPVRDPEVVGEVDVHFLSFGGSTVIVVHNGSKTVVVNSGNVEGSDRLRSYLRSIGVSRIEYLILTEGSRNYTGGAEVLLRNFGARFIIMSEANIRLGDNRGLESFMLANNLVRSNPVEGSVYEVAGFSFRMFNTVTLGEIVEDSPVILFNNGRDRLLLSGDFGVQAMKRMFPDFTDRDIVYMTSSGVSRWVVGSPLSMEAIKATVVLSQNVGNFEWLRGLASDLTKMEHGGVLVLTSKGLGFDLEQ